MNNLIFFFFLPLFSYELSIAAIFQNEAPFLKEWIEYHRMVGVEHFWLYNDNSTDHWQEVLTPYINEEIVELIEWPIPHPIRYIEYQVLACQDAIRRAQGKSTWLASIDIDEFLFPQQEHTVTECLNRHFSNASGVFINWRNFGTGGISIDPGDPILFQLTAASKKSHPRNLVGKSIIRPEQVECDSVWCPHHFVLKSQAQYYNGDALPIPFTGVDLIPHDRYPHDQYIRINHYAMRDENFFYQTRLQRAEKWGIEEWLTWKHYHEFSQESDFSIAEFIRIQHPEWHNKFWKSSPISKSQKSFVLATFTGDLGDQLFQAAAASAYAWDHNAEICLPDVQELSSAFKHLFFRFKNQLPAQNIPYEWVQTFNGYQPILLPPNIRLKGSFKSEKYFVRHREQLLKLLTPNFEDKKLLQMKYHWILNHPSSVGISLSRGSQEEVSFLQKAMDLFPVDSLFIVSSAHLDFDRNFFSPKKVSFIENEPDYMHLFILSSCKNHIIVHSSLGWWGAWLNQYPNKKVICSKTWDTVEKFPDIYPDEWVQLE